MKLIIKKATFLLMTLLIGSKLLAQTADTTHKAPDYVQPLSGNAGYRTWSIGLGGGIMTPFTILGSNSRQDFTSPDPSIGYGGYIKKQFTPGFGIQGELFAGKLKADISHPDANGNSTLKNFTTTIKYAVSLSTNVSVGNITFHGNKNAVQPYFTAGGGFINYTPVITDATGSKNFKKTGSGAINEFFVPIGVGLKFNMGRGVNLDMGYRINFLYSDNIDGYNYGNNNDRFSYAHIGFEFALGKRSKPQLAVHNPVSSMRKEYELQNLATKMQLQAQIDSQKVQNEKIKAEAAATNATLLKFTTDSDGDGVADFYDKCPHTPAGVKVDGSGCPLPAPKPEVKVYVTDDDRRVVKEAIKDLEFDSGRATIREHSFASLDKVAHLLVDKNFSLKLAGHTDSTGSADINLALSKDRAEAIKTYLVSKGANPSRIEATGYGKTQPIATNKTKAGRQMNRRVEFSLY